MASEKDKLKKGQTKRNKYLFVALWLIGHALAWTAFIPVIEMVDSAFDETGIYATVALLVGGITSLTQYLLIRWQFGRNIKAWIPVSLVTWLLSMFLIFPFVENFGTSTIDIMIQGLVIFSPAALVQTFLLRKHVQQAWLWLLASIAGTATFSMPIAFDYGNEWTIVAGYGLYACATALTLLWLFGMSGAQIQQKAKDHTSNRLTDEDETGDEDYLEDQQVQKKLAK